MREARLQTAESMRAERTGIWMKKVYPEFGENHNMLWHSKTKYATLGMYLLYQRGFCVRIVRRIHLVS